MELGEEIGPPLPDVVSYQPANEKAALRSRFLAPGNRRRPSRHQRHADPQYLVHSALEFPSRYQQLHFRAGHQTASDTSTRRR